MQRTLVISALILALVSPDAAQAEEPHGTYIKTSAGSARKPARDGDFPILFLNRYGGTYSPGNEDSSSNHSSIIGQTSTVSEFHLGDDKWAEVFRCVQLQFGPFGITVTDINPGFQNHIEAVVGGIPAEIGFSSGVGGVSPFTNDCGYIETAIVYIFAQVYRTNTRRICEVIAQEVGHSLGMDHEYLCEDPMTYLTNCTEKSFQDQTAFCGEYEPRTCACGGTTQNSVLHLNDLLGPGEAEPPEVAITEPADGSSLAAGFDVAAEASDNILIAKLEFYLDGELERELEEEPFAFTASSTLVPGEHLIEAVAYDAAGNESSAEVTITVTAECMSDEGCAEGSSCVDFYCLGNLGSECTTHSDCDPSLLCAMSGVTGICTRNCDEGDSCPSGYSCSENGGGSPKCWPATGEGGGCSIVRSKKEQRPSESGNRQRRQPWDSGVLISGLLALLASRRQSRARSTKSLRA